MSSSTWALLESEPLVGEALEYSGGIDVKGKGMMDTYLWAPLPPGSAAVEAVAAAVAAYNVLPGGQQGQHPQLPQAGAWPQQQQPPPGIDNIIFSTFQTWFFEDSPRPGSTPIQPPGQPLGSQPPTSQVKHNSEGQHPHPPNKGLSSLAEAETLDTRKSLNEGAIAGTQLNLTMLSVPNPASTLSQIMATSLSSMRSSLESSRVARTTYPAAALPPPCEKQLLGLLNATLRLLDVTTGAEAGMGAVEARTSGAAAAWRPRDRGGGRGGPGGSVSEGLAGPPGAGSSGRQRSSMRDGPRDLPAAVSSRAQGGGQPGGEGSSRL